ncbi:hypothetical protein [Antarcticimicrobium luteum]|uniref:Uncharacterized protein n=1 Tax=Antarcticimicrobium luteum TaxID=2547397 RepID=A0A4R5V0P9_9RHOB|nr:hypothetical protein [Antarcticimicrobium luteum]TDK45121.1 hypothetical protein E1832_14735 [Antarcticimicrobium luteum]
MPKLTKISVSLPKKPTKADEKAFEKILKALQDAQAKIGAALDAIEADEPLVPDTADRIKKQRAITERSRAAELKDLEKSKKRGELHSNPAKLERLIKDLNSDISKINDIEGSVHNDRNLHFGKELGAIEDEITRTLPKGVSAQSILLPALLKKFETRNGKAGWKNFSKERKALVGTCRDLGAEQARRNGISALANDAEMRKLKYNKRQKIVEDGLKDKGATIASVRKALEDALDDQDKPDKARWASFLELGAGGSYTLAQSGSYRGNKIHVTMSSDSWTSDANGKVSIEGNSVKGIYEKLLKQKGAKGWKELHATLEVRLPCGKNPHVFLFAGIPGNNQAWQELAGQTGWTPQAVDGVQKAMRDELDKVEARLLRKIKDAKDSHGATVY